MVVKSINLFLVHTPLQVIAAANVIHQYCSTQKNILIFEGEELSFLAEQIQHTDFYSAKQTRTVTHDPKFGINFNIKLIKDIIKKNNPTHLHLFISELQWMCNKSAFALLKNMFKENFSCSFFDEGLHIYINNEKFSEETKIKTWLKYIWMRLHNLPSILRYTGSFYKKNDINAIYCYHSNLIKRECYSNTKILPLDFSFVDFFKKNTPLLHYEKNSLLFLSQAYYWDIPLKKFQEIMKDLVDDFRSRGIEKFYIKPHHSDTSEWITWMQENLKFEQTTLSKNMPIELLASTLPYDYVVSISSSALLNLKTFGFQGLIISYGAKRCSLTNKYKNIHEKIIPFFIKNKIEVID